MKRISLDGIWKCKNAASYRGGEQEWPRVHPFAPLYDIKIPGTVQEAMEHLTGDLHLGHNVLSARWIEEDSWLLTRSFDISPSDLESGKRVRLVFEGLDLYAEVFVNGERVGEHHNFYTPYRVDITDRVKVGENRLDVKLESGLVANAFKPAENSNGTPREKAMRRRHQRRPQSAFEWDWSPRLLNVGIFRPCYLEIGSFFANEVSVFHDITKDYSRADIRIRQFISAPKGSAVSVEAKILETGEVASFEGVLEGETYAPLSLSVSSPRLWQPRGHGDPYRYTLKITVRNKATDETVSVEEKKIGLRRVEIDQSPTPDGGKLFRLMINGVQVFAKGANMVPLDILFSKLTRDRYETLVDRAIEANFNALRVWGGGLYETDDFYDICDERGVIVWQDFLGACTNTPADDRDFVENYCEEIAYQSRRMSVFASAVVYCGNNEIDWIMQYDWNLSHYTDAALYYSIAPQILYREGDNHFYWPSSPYSPDGSPANNNKIGDQHPWQIGFENRDYFEYRNMDCRFPNEGGLLGPTSLPNMMAALSKGQEYMYSFDFALHDNSLSTMIDQAPDHALLEKLGIDLRNTKLTIPDYVYYGGFLQGDALTEYILNFRRRMSDTTDSAIFWMYSDCWPATRSWTIVDYLRNRTPSFYPVKRAFAPIVVDIVAEDGGFDIYGVNEMLRDESLTLKLGCFTPDGKGEWQEIDVTLGANASTKLARIEREEICDGVIPCAMLLRDGEIIAKRRYVDRAYHEIGIPPADIEVDIKDGVATYTSRGFAIGVCLDLDGDDGELSDNFFDLFPGVPHRVRLGSKSGRVLYCLNS